MAISGAIVNESISPDTQLYSCESKQLVSDCVNGVKAEGLRCYYNETNARSYSYCPEGWKEYNLHELKTTRTNYGNKYVCDPLGCVAE